MLKQRTQRLLVSLVSVGVIGVAAALLRAEDVPLAPAPEAAAAGTPGTPFQLYAADEGAIPYEDLVEGPVPAPTAEEIAAGTMSPARYHATTRETKASADDTMAWADLNHSPDVANAYAAYTAAMQAEAEARRAEYAAGLTGESELGVVP